MYVCLSTICRDIMCPTARVLYIWYLTWAPSKAPLLGTQSAFWPKPPVLRLLSKHLVTLVCIVSCIILGSLPASTTQTAQWAEGASIQYPCTCTAQTMLIYTAKAVLARYSTWKSKSDGVSCSILKQYSSSQFACWTLCLFISKSSSTGLGGSRVFSTWLVDRRL